MSLVFQNIDPPPPSPPGKCVPPPLLGGGGHTRREERGWGVNILEDERHRIMYIITTSTGATLTMSIKL
jgi:hypothetical protein